MSNKYLLEQAINTAWRNPREPQSEQLIQRTEARLNRMAYLR